MAEVMAFGARAIGLPTKVYEGLIGSGSIDWTERMSFNSADNNDMAPVRVVREGGVPVILQYDLGAAAYPHEQAYMMRYKTGFTSESMFGERDFASYPTWEEFDINSNGLAVLLNASSSLHSYRLRVSTDYGVTWGAAINIDYLYTLLGDTQYKKQYPGERSFCCTVDEKTGTFYILLLYESAGYVPHWLLIKSSNGTAWTLVKQWDPASSYNAECQMAIYDGKYYVWYSDSGGTAFCLHSSDGTNWTQTSLGMSNTGYLSFAASKDVALVYIPMLTLPSLNCYQAIIKRSTDGGANWSQVLQIDVAANPPMPKWRSMRLSGKIALATFCHIYSPLTGASWKGADEVVHDMSGEGTAYLCFWMSKDSGLNWTLELSPIESTRRQQTLDVYAIIRSGSSTSLVCPNPPGPVQEAPLDLLEPTAVPKFEFNRRGLRLK